MGMKVRVGLILTLFSFVAAADVLTVDISPTITGPSAGLFSYSYDVTNDNSSSENLFSLAIGESGPLTSIASPARWVPDTISTPGFIIWTSDDQTTDLTPGSTDVFGFTSFFKPGAQSFLGFGSDATTGFPTGDLDLGSTVGPSVPPSAVPEPSSLSLLAIGFSVIGLIGGPRAASQLMPRRLR